MLILANKPIKSPIIIAPMAGITNGAFRELCFEFGAGLVYTEMVSDKAIFYNNAKTMDMLKIDDNYHPISLQLFGSEKETMVYAAKIIDKQTNCDFIDINMGCPVNKVVKTGAGSALMKTPELAAKIIKSVSAAVKLPVTCKFRIGWTENSINVKEFASAVVEAGAKAITVHARTRQAMYTGPAQWQYLEGIKDIARDIPFFANGDICSEEHVVELYERTGCDGFMIGRGCVGKPWLYSQLLGHSELLDPRLRFPIFRHHLIDMLMEHGTSAVPLFRVHLFGYLRNHPHSAALRRSLCMERNPNVVMKTGEEFFTSNLNNLESTKLH